LFVSSELDGQRFQMCIQKPLFEQLDDLERSRQPTCLPLRSIYLVSYCTVTVTVVEAVVFELTESVPVTVKTYVPAVVALTTGPVLEPPPLPPPPQPISAADPTSQNRSTIDTQRDRRFGIRNISKPAKTVPPPSFHKLL
jgi:hypothetical protein